jgi:hypothetical protein
MAGKTILRKKRPYFFLEELGLILTRLAVLRGHAGSAENNK